MKTKATLLMLATAIFGTAAVFVLIETLILHEDLKRSITLGLVSGVGAASGMLIYLNFLKRKYLKENK